MQQQAWGAIGFTERVSRAVHFMVQKIVIEGRTKPRSSVPSGLQIAIGSWLSVLVAGWHPGLLTNQRAPMKIGHNARSMS